MSYYLGAVEDPRETRRRREAMRQIRKKRAFWNHAAIFAVVTAAFWISWVIGGLREEWIAPWPVIPTLVWGALLVGHALILGGPRQISHRQINRELEMLRHPTSTVYHDRMAPTRPIQWGNIGGFTPAREFHLHEVIDARRQAAAETVIDLRDGADTTSADA